MPTHKQGTVNSTVTEWGAGKASSDNMKAEYAFNPVGTDDELNDDGTIDAAIRAHYISLTQGVINDGGHTFGEFDTNYGANGAPAYDDVETGDGGLPDTAWTPNPVSPGPGSANPSDISGTPPVLPTPSDTPGVGVGSQLSPADSSAAQSGATLGDYGFGKSPYQD